MSAKAIREAVGKDLINRKLAAGTKAVKCRYVLIEENTNWTDVVNQNPWLKSEQLVVKPDQLIKRRGKLGLIKVNANLDTVKQWVGERMNKDQQIGKTVGKLRTFIVEPFVPHKQVRILYSYKMLPRSSELIMFLLVGGRSLCLYLFPSKSRHYFIPS